MFKFYFTYKSQKYVELAKTWSPGPGGVILVYGIQYTYS